MDHPSANRDVLPRAVEASATEYALVEVDRPGLTAVLEDLGWRVVTETWLQETSGHPLAVVEAVEARMDAVTEGLRFGEAVPSVDGAADDAVVVTDLPTDLIDAAAGVDAGATRAAVAGVSVAFETTEGGTRPRGRVALPADDPTAAADALTEALAAVLRESYDEVRREGGDVIARTEAFDPAAARTLGVPEGPAFGRLADGQAVDVDGERIDPAAVRTERVERFSAVTFE
jgi:D-aminoacyl-tRNA deacylase